LEAKEGKEGRGRRRKTYRERSKTMGALVLKHTPFALLILPNH
jgi:hypothetical protein